jgi:hypothetical protein
MADVEKYSGIEMADIEKISGHDAPSEGGGGTPSTTPTIDLTQGLFGSISVEVTNHSTYTNPNYSANSKVGGVTTVSDADIDHGLESDKSHVTDTLQFQDLNTTSGQRTFTLTAQDYGEGESASATATYNIAGPPASRYIRIRGVNSNGSNSASRLGIWNLRFYTGASQSGTSHPTNMTSATTDTNGDNFYTVSVGHEYGGYVGWKAFDSSSSIFNMWWALGTSAANNYIQLKFDGTEFPTPPSINSFAISMYGSGNYASYIAFETSNDGSTFSQLGVFAINSSSNSQQNFG